jgi:hypothetical protein
LSWVYSQTTGELRRSGAAGILDGPEEFGYSGNGVGKNNPERQDQRGVGPIPRGLWRILEPRDTDTHGPYVLPLTPDPTTATFGRSGFLIHGDSAAHLGEASEGCIILPRKMRRVIWESDDHELTVIAR